MLYLILLFFLLLLSYFYDYRQINSGKIFCYIICLLVFILISGLRYRIGLDSVLYEYKYSFYPNLSQLSSYNFLDEKFGVGFVVLMAIAKSISNDFYVFQLIHAILVNSIIFWFFFKYTRNIFFSVFLYFILFYFSFNFEILRESCAVSFFLLASKFLGKNLFKYYILVFCAILFHTSAMIALVLPIFYTRIFKNIFSINKFYWITLACVLALSSILYVKFFDYIRMLSITDIDSYASLYEDRANAQSANINIFGFITYAIRFFIYPIFAIVWLKSKKIISGNTIDGFQDKLGFFCCMFTYIAVASLFIQILNRFNNYFYPFIVLAISDALYSYIRRGNKKYRYSFMVYMFLVCPYIFVSVYGFFKPENETSINRIRRYYPYESIIDPKTDNQREILFGSYHYK